MDTELARTFLAVVSAGNFVAAAERLHVTQSTVSVRIQTLEQQLRCVLFVRNKAGASLTAAGRQFYKHASVLVRTVEQARHEVGIAQDFSGTLTVGGRIGLWEEYLLRWLPAMRAELPDVAIRAESALEPELMQGLVEGRIDIGVMYTPQSRPGLKVEQLFVEQLVLVSTRRGHPPEPRQNYVYIDWGPEFYARHIALFPDFGGAAVTANIGWLGLQHVLENGGSGYFPRRIVAPLIGSGQLHVAAGAPDFNMAAYVAFHDDGDNAAIAQAVTLMHRLAAAGARPAPLRTKPKPRRR